MLQFLSMNVDTESRGDVYGSSAVSRICADLGVKTIIRGRHFAINHSSAVFILPLCRSFRAEEGFLHFVESATHFDLVVTRLARLQEGLRAAHH